MSKYSSHHTKYHLKNKSQCWGWSSVGRAHHPACMRPGFHPCTILTRCRCLESQHLKGGDKRIRSSGSFSITFQVQGHSGLHEIQSLKINKWKLTLVTLWQCNYKDLKQNPAYPNSYSSIVSFLGFHALKNILVLPKIQWNNYSLLVDTETEEKYSKNMQLLVYEDFA